MADINVIRPKETDLHASRGGNVYVPYRIERMVKLKDLAELKGSAVDAGDKVKILKIPANTAILAAFVGVEDPIKSTSLTVDVNVDTVPFVTAADLRTLTLNQTSATIVTPAPTTVVNETDKVVELVFNRITSPGDTDAIRVSFLVVDVSRSRRSDIAPLVR